MHRTQVYLPDEDYRSLREFSQQRGLTMAESVRRAVERYLKEETASSSSLEEAIVASSGCWGERTESTEGIVRAMRDEWSKRELSG